MKLIDELDALSEKATKGLAEAFYDPTDCGWALQLGKVRKMEGYSRPTLRGFVDEGDIRLLVALRNNWPAISKVLRAAVNWSQHSDTSASQTEEEAKEEFRQALRELDA